MPPEQSPCATMLSDEAHNILYASPHLEAFLGEGIDIREGTTLPSFLQGLQLDSTQVKDTLKSLHLEPGRIVQKLHHVQLYTRSEYKAVLDGSLPAKVGVALLPVATPSGQKITLKMIMALFDDLDSNPHCLTLLYDFTEQVSVEHLMGIASTGEYFEVLRHEKVGARSPECLRYLSDTGRALLAGLSHRRSQVRQVSLCSAISVNEDEAKVTDSGPETREKAETAANVAVRRLGPGSGKEHVEEDEEGANGVQEGMTDAEAMASTQGPPEFATHLASQDEEDVADTPAIDGNAWRRLADRP